MLSNYSPQNNCQSDYKYNATVNTGPSVVMSMFV